MNVLHLKNIASTPIKLNDITAIKCSRTALSDSWTRSFLASVISHYLLQSEKKVLLALPHYEFKEKLFKKALVHEGVEAYLTEEKHTLHQLDCYLGRVREEGTQIGLVVISLFDAFAHKSVKESGGRRSWVRSNMKKETIELVKELRQMSVKYGCRFLLRSSVRTTPGLASQKNCPVYGANKIRPSQREKFLVGSKNLTLFKIKKYGNGNEDAVDLLSIRDELNQDIFYFPPSLIPYLE